MEKTPNFEQQINTLFMGQTKDGKEVYDREDSHFHYEGGMTPELLASALSVIDTKGQKFLIEQVNFDRQVGEETCVPVDENDEIVMVIRKNRKGPTPMVKNREPVPCNSVVAILRQDDDEQEKYRLITGYVGNLAPREPWDPNFSSEEEQQAAQDFWNTHALLYNEDLIDKERTEAANKICKKTIYAGVFLDHDELYSKISPKLEKEISSPHVTTSFRPGIDGLHLNSLGSKAKITAIGYGIDAENEGLLVRIEAEDKEVQRACDALETPHITLSISENGQAKNTANLHFSPLETPIELTGEYGLFLKGSPKFSIDETEGE